MITRKNLTAEVNSFKLIVIVFFYCPYFGVHIDGSPAYSVCSYKVTKLIVKILSKPT